LETGIDLNAITDF